MLESSRLKACLHPSPLAIRLSLRMEPLTAHDPYRPPGRFLPLKLISEDVYDHVCDNLGLRGYRDLVRHFWQEMTFDRQYGVSTREKVAVGDLDFGQAQVQLHAAPYHPSPPFCVREGFDRLTRYLPDFEEVSFVDYGCGKGRVMILAAVAGFKEIIGLELSSRLVAVCEENLRRYALHGPHSARFTVLNQNAAYYTPPPTSSVFFFFNPFDATIFRQVLQQIDNSIRQQPRTAYLLTLGTSYGVAPEGFRLIDQVTGVSLYSNR